MTYRIVILLHLLGAAVWIGGHIVLLLVVVPAARRQNDAQQIFDFERGYGKIGIGALALQVVTGLWLAHHWVPDWRAAFGAPTSISHLVLTKVVLLVLTIALAGHAYYRVLPKLSSDHMGSFLIHAWITTVVAILMMVAGVSVRFGGLF